MQIFTEIEPLRAFLSSKKAARRSIGFVPTMGALHLGHLFLIASSRAENDLTVGSIYVNPTQFNNAGDLAKYPRSIEQDKAMLEKGGCDVLFCPGNEEMYAHSSKLKFDFGELDTILEGKYRPGHFSGVALVVSKLFNIVQPDIAYFGQKDFQQFMIISRLAEELKFRVSLRCVPTFRESNGLAMSSRNLRLNATARDKAIILYQSLSFASRALQEGRSFVEIKKEISINWEKEPDVKLEYFELANRENLMLSDRVKSANQSILLIAGYVGEVRLIDNMIVGEK